MIRFDRTEIELRASFGLKSLSNHQKFKKIKKFDFDRSKFSVKFGSFTVIVFKCSVQLMKSVRTFWIDKIFDFIEKIYHLY